VASVSRNTDAQALDAIAHMLRDPEWAVGMLEDIAEIISATSRTIEERCGSCGHPRHAVPCATGQSPCYADGCACVRYEPLRTWERH